MNIYTFNYGKGFLWEFFSNLFEEIQQNFWSLIVLLVIVIIILIILKRKKIKITNIFRIEIPRTIEYKKIKLHINKKNRKLAYNIWVELSTRKIAIDFDEENDTILLVHKSWYVAFGLIRDYIKELGSDIIDHDSRITSMSILNNSLRPHLTKYHNRFEKWFNQKDSIDKDPQILQKQYPRYRELVDDIKKVNSECKEYLKILEKIIGSNLY